jgi:hypothetical protein
MPPDDAACPQNRRCRNMGAPKGRRLADAGRKPRFSAGRAASGRIVYAKIEL